MSGMERRRAILGLRIAVSAGFGMLCVLFIAMWVRSHYKKDDCRGMIGNSILNVQSLRGELGIGCWTWRFKPIAWQTFSENVESTERLWPPMADRLPLSIIGIRWQKFGPDMTLFAVSYWTLVALSAAIAAVPWIPWLRWRFSLRTLLIVTALIALALGLVAVLRADG